MRSRSLNLAPYNNVKRPRSMPCIVHEACPEKLQSTKKVLPVCLLLYTNRTNVNIFSLSRHFCTPSSILLRPRPPSLTRQHCEKNIAEHPTHSPTNTVWWIYERTACHPIMFAVNSYTCCCHISQFTLRFLTHPKKTHSS